MPEGTTFLGVVIKQVVLGASAFAIGVLLYRTLVFERRRRRPWLAMGFGGMAVALALIAELVVRAPLISAEWRTWLYLVALLCIAIGFLGDATRGKR
jgi:hypothetical protein